MYHMLYQSVTQNSVPTVYSWFLYDSQNKQLLFPYTVLTDLSLKWRHDVFSLWQEMDLKYQMSFSFKQLNGALFFF